MFVFMKSCRSLVGNTLLSALLIGVQFLDAADIPESVFPKGPFALPMSSDGCPEESSRGWYEGYISITTSTLFNQSKAYLSSCGGLSKDIPTTRYSFTSVSDTNILHTFDSDTIRWNFCFKSADHSINSAATWPDEIYGIFGAMEGCPDGFTTHDLRSCLPPVLHYNSDGHLPYFNIEVNSNNSVLTLRYCRRVKMIEDSQSLQTIDSLYPFFVIQDPRANGCPDVEGYSVSSELFPGPMYSMILDLNVSFPLTFCYFVSHMFEYAELERIKSNTTNFKDYTGSSFLDIQIFLPSAEQFILGVDGAVESWLMIDARRTYLVSGIVFQTFGFDSATPSFHRTNGTQAHVSRIFIGDERWSFLYGGALRCRFSVFTSVDVWYWYVQAGVDAYTCLRSQLGRHITMIFYSSETLGDILQYNDTFITVITNEEEKDLKILRCNEELGMNNYEIKDSQLTASSWQEAFPPSQARPWQSGWCATRGDRQPYIQIDLQEETKVDGVVLRYWYSVEDTAICDTVLGGTKPKGSYIFSLEYGSVLSQMRKYKDKTFVYDITQTLKTSQTYLLAEKVEARFFRILTASFTNSSAPCIKFELLGCRKSYSPNITKYGTKIDQHLAVYFEVPYISINHAQMLSSFGYPASYDYNIFYKWNISIPNAFAFLQFEDISLRTFGYNESLNTMGCVDHIIVTEIDVVNPLTMVKDYYLYVATQNSLAYKINAFIRILLTSEDNGKMPGIPGTGEVGGSLYVAFMSCSAGNVIAPGRGFRAYVVNADFPVCMSIDQRNNYCDNRRMVIISHRFLGIDNPATAYFYSVVNTAAAAVMRVKVIDFAISCNADSLFRFIVREGSMVFCNENIFEEKLFMAYYFIVRYTKRTLSNCEDTVLLEGFHFEYEMINRKDWLPDYNLVVQDHKNTTIDTDFIIEFITKKVCSSNFKKCYSLEFQQTSWTDAAYFCRSKNMQMVTIKSKQELHYLQQLLIDVHGPNIALLEKNNLDFSTAEMFIGLVRFLDVSGVHHEHWIDGTPLTVSAWSENQPADILLKKCTKMVLNPEEVGKENAWETESCDLKSEAVYVVCEYGIGDPDTSPNVSEKIDDCYETTASEYKGNVSRTRYGHVCQKWTNRTRNKHLFTNRKDFPDSRIKDASNHCRSPDGDDTPWCFTMDTMVPWDYCQIPKCLSAKELEPLPKDPVTLFRCNSGEWMSHTVRCNNMSECLDSSDEDNCTTSSELCKSDEFTCVDGRCIHMYQVCNHVADCDDASDEFCDFRSCDAESEFKCDNGQCISIATRCDSVKHCKDGSDEILCESCNLDRAFQCGDRSCISKRLVCDLRVDCSDGSDENMCNHVYETCDQVWEDGLTQDGIYLTGSQGYRTLCQLNKTSGLLTMQYLNSDWRRVNPYTYEISFPDFTLVSEYADTNGYRCSQEIDEVPHREMQRVMAFSNVDQDPLTAKSHYNDDQYKSNDLRIDFNGDRISLLKTFNRSEKRLLVHNIRCVKGLSSWTNTSFCMRDLKSEKQMRWCLRGIKFEYYETRCHSMEGCGRNRWNENIHCSKGKIIERNQMCIYDYDENDIIAGCRTLNHLQNCENVPCPEHHFKCPRSYCVPVMYVCNGRIDCPNGADEKECGVAHQQNRSIVIIVPSSDIIPLDRSALLSETAARFGGTLYSDQSQVRIIKLRQLNKNRFLLESREVMSNSEYPNKLFDNYDLNEADQTWDLLFWGKQNATNAFLWLTDTPEYTYAEDFVFSSFRNSNVSKTVLKYRIVTGPHSTKDFTVTHQFDVTQVKIRDSNILGTLGSVLFPDIYTGKPFACKGKYRCSLSLVCIPFMQVCDGRSHCPYGDDEVECDFICPDRCTCKPLIVSCANVHNSRNETIFIPATTRVIDASNTSNLGSGIMLKPEENNFHHLMFLNISRCGIEFLNDSSFQNLQNLLTLDISFNKLTKLVRDTFVNLKSLRELHMDENHYLQEIEPGAFNGLQIKYLVINNAQLKSLSPNTFYGLNLKTLDLSRNRIKTVIDLTFNGLISQDIYLVDNQILDFSKKMFDGLTGVENLKTPAYKFCCIRPAYLNEESCLPHRDEFSSCQNLMRNTTLQALMWVIGFLALIGNIISVFYRLIYDRKRLKLGYGMFVTNLAISDFLMGVYMLIIAVADKIFMDRYIEVDEYWRNSSWCKLAGAISTISSEGSVLFMCLITIDRILVVKFPFGQYRFSTFSACMSIALTWIISFIIAVLPVLYEDYFQGKFYSKSGVCLALPLTRDRPPGWLYAILIFVGFNLITFTLIAVGQLLIYMEIRKQSKMKKRMNVNRTNDLRVARNLLLLVGTDFMCWFPVGLMGILAMAGYVIPGEMYAWTAVLILPINSALNPFMYTFAAIIGQRAFQPSVTEQSMIEPSKESAKVVLTILPYTTMHNGSTNSTICSLSELLRVRSLDVEEAVYIIHVLTRYIDLLHDSSMVLGDINVRHIMITVSSNYQKMKAVKIWKMPKLSSQKRGQGNDIYNIGIISEILLNSVRN